MKKILFTINFITNGGPTRILENIVKTIDKNKYEIYIVTLINENNENLVNKIKSYNVNIIELNYNKKLSDILKNENEIIEKIEEIKPDIIHTHGIVSTIIVRNSKIKAKKITTIHNNIFEDYKYTYGAIKGKIFAWIHIISLNKFNDIICCSKTSYEVLKQYVKNISYIRNGIDIDKSLINKEARLNIRSQLKIDNNAIVYMYGGVINSRKRVVQLVELFNNNLSDDEYLIIVGDGELKEKAEMVSKSDRIKFVGFKNNIIDYFQAADVYVSNSSSEGFSVSIIEGLESGLLLLLSDISSHKECFEIDKNYYLGEYFNIHNFEEKKKRIKKNIDYDRKKVKQFKETYLSSKAMTIEYEKFYDKD